MGPEPAVPLHTRGEPDAKSSTAPATAAAQGVVALSLVLPRRRPAGRQQLLQELLPFLALRSGAGTADAAPAGLNSEAMTWQEPRWWAWPDGDVAPALTPAASPTAVPASAPTAPAPSPHGGLETLAALMPAVRWIERAPASVLPTHSTWLRQPPLGLLALGVRVPGASAVRSAPAATPPSSVVERVVRVGEQEQGHAGRPTEYGEPQGTREPGSQGQQDLPLPQVAAMLAGTPSPIVPARAAGAGLQGAAALPFAGSRAAGGLWPTLPSLALDAVQAIPTRGAAAGRGPESGPDGPGAAPRLPYAAQMQRQLAIPTAQPGNRQPPRELPWPDVQPAISFAEGASLPLAPGVPARAGTATAAGESAWSTGPEPGPYTRTAERSIASIAGALQVTEHLVKRQVREEVTRESKRIAAQVDEQLRAEHRQTLDEMVGDEIVERLIQKMRVVAREERFRLGQVR